MSVEPFSPPRREPDRVAALDGVRGIAILMVVAMHGVLIGMPLKGGPNPLTLGCTQYILLGWCGVDVFFVLSGFLITGILLQSRESPHYFRNFYLRRALRIFPLYYAVIVLLLWVLPRPPADGAQQLSYLLYYQNLLMGLGHPEVDIARGVTWSLAIEEQFYLVWPAVVWIAGRRWLVPLCAMLILAAIASRFVLVANGLQGTYYLTPCRLDTLAAGALLAVLPLPPKAFGWLLALGGAAWLVSISQYTHNSLPHVPAFQGWGLIAALLLAVGVLVVARHPGWFSRLIANRLLMSIGRYSYCIYLTHFLVIEWVFWRLFGVPDAPAAGWQQWLVGNVPGAVLLMAALGIYMAATWLLGFASYHLFEQWFLRLKRFFPSR